VARRQPPKPTRRSGDDWTASDPEERKIAIVSKYAAAYSSILAGHRLKHFYIDGFAGGPIALCKEAGEQIAATARPCLGPSSKSAFALISPDVLFSCCDLVIGSERPSHAQQEVLSTSANLVQDASWATQCISDTAEFLRKTLSRMSRHSARPLAEIDLADHWTAKSASLLLLRFSADTNHRGLWPRPAQVSLRFFGFRNRTGSLRPFSGCPPLG
jgi:hypothetical protein